MMQEKLKYEVERITGHQLRVSRDFEELSHLLLLRTHEWLSPTTLKRFWGYLSNEKVETRPHTLDVLARFVGYKGYDDFCSHADSSDEVQSGIRIEERVSTEGM